MLISFPVFIWYLYSSLEECFCLLFTCLNGLFGFFIIVFRMMSLCILNTISVTDSGVFQIISSSLQLLLSSSIFGFKVKCFEIMWIQLVNFSFVDCTFWYQLRINCLTCITEFFAIFFLKVYNFTFYV